jgi:hypothetical protein
MNNQLAGRELGGYFPTTTPMKLGTVVVLGIGAYMLYKYLYKK